MRENRKGIKKGIVFVFVYLVVISLLILSAGIMMRVGSEHKLAQINALHTEALYLAEAAVEQASFDLADVVANHAVEPGAAGEYFDLLNVTASNFLSSDFDVDYSCQALDTDTVLNPGSVVTFKRHYRITAVVTHPDFDTSVTVNQVLARNKTFTFQHAVFYMGDLEMIPGKDMTLSGKVHCNSDVYIAANGSRDYTLDVGGNTDFAVDTNYVYTAGDIYNKRKDNINVMNGDVFIKDMVTDNYELVMDVTDADPLDCDRGDWATESQNRWGGTVQSSVHGVTALAAPEVGSIQPDGFFADKAGDNGLKIFKKADNTWEISHNGTPLNVSDLPPGTITESTFRDNREGKDVTVVNINMEQLNKSDETFTDVNTNGQYDIGEPYNDANGNGTWDDLNGNSQYDPSYFPSTGGGSNGILYVAREDASAANPNGVRLVDGSELNGDVTVVSSNPVYIQGDYNNVNKKGAAVICDAVNILSNSWNDADSYAGLNSRVASDTAVNTAFIAGNVPTPDGGGNYSGGIENYPRLHEKWSNKELTIRGSFIQLWESEVARGLWQYGAPVYTAPRRNWDYDTDFNNSANLPPFTPCAVDIDRVAWDIS